ncbi:MAG: nucleotide disphospho-sugar-binding domain-containing protein [Bryobacteraceae bacterium]
MAIFAELVRRGEQLTIYADATYRDAIEAAGAAYRSYGDMTPVAGRSELAHRLVQKILAELNPDPDYLVLDAQADWGQMLAGILRLPSIAYCTTCWPRGEMLELEESNDQCRGDLNLVLVPRALQFRAETYGQSFRFVGRCVEEGPEADEFPWHELGPDPVIYISAAGIFGGRSEFLRACMAAFGGLPFEVVVSREEIPSPAPANFRLAQSVPLRKLLERATLAVTGAQSDIVEECARAGVPHVMYPGAGEASSLAFRVQQLGAGLRLTDADLAGGRLRELAGRVMADPSYCRAAEALSRSVRESRGTAQACEEILAFARRIKK